MKPKLRRRFEFKLHQTGSPEISRNRNRNRVERIQPNASKLTTQINSKIKVNSHRQQKLATWSFRQVKNSKRFLDHDSQAQKSTSSFELPFKPLSHMYEIKVERLFKVISLLLFLEKIRMLMDLAYFRVYLKGKLI